jgi:hypothetical protein
VEFRPLNFRKEVVIVLSSAKLDKLNRLLKQAYRDKKAASDTEDGLWREYHVIKSDNEAKVSYLCLDNDSVNSRKIFKLTEEIEVIQDIYMSSLSKLNELEQKCIDLKEQIFEVERQQAIARSAGVKECYIDCVSIKKNPRDGTVSIWYNNCPNVFSPGYGHIILLNGTIIYDRGIGQPHGEHNYVYSPRYKGRNQTVLCQV